MLLEDMQQNLILFDWFAFNTKLHTPQEIISLLGLGDLNWQQLNGAKGYRKRLYAESISIHYDGLPDMGVWVEMSGQGVRAFETYSKVDITDIFQLILVHSDKMHLTRLDVAFDDHTGILPFDQILADSLVLDDDGHRLNVVSRMRQLLPEGSHNNGDPRFAWSITHGKKSSEILLRIYDKAMERGFPDCHWVRCELQLNHKRADEFVRLLVDDNGLSVGDVYRGVVYNYVRYVDPSDSDSNRWRWPLKDYWQAFLGAASGIRLWRSPGKEYNIRNVESYVYGQACEAINTLIDIFGVLEFKAQIKDHAREVRPVKYQTVIDDYRNELLNRHAREQAARQLVDELERKGVQCTLEREREEDRSRLDPTQQNKNNL